jgi:hypothetical protein
MFPGGLSLLILAMASAPAAPSSLVAVRDGGYSAVWVTWTDNSNDEDNFELQYDTDSGFGSPTSVYPAANKTLHRVSGLTRGQTYYFRIRAVNGAGSSSWSNTDSATIFQLSDVSPYADYDANAGVYQDSGTTPVASDGDSVGQVQDQTGNGRHITQTTASSKPVWKTSQLNSLPIIRNDVGDFLKAATASDWKFMHDGTEFAVFTVWKTAIANPGEAYVILDTGALAGVDIGFAQWYDDRSAVPRNDNLLSWISRGGGAFLAQATTVDYAGASNAWHVHSSRLTASAMGNFADGQYSRSISANKSGTPSSSNPTSALTVGARHNNTFNLKGDWARVIIVSGSVSDANHRAIQDYLSETYEPFRTRFFGSEVVVQHDSSGLDHNGFPGLGLAANGDLLLGYSKNNSHASQDGKLVYRISSDKGDTWGAEQTVWDYSTDGGGTDLWFTPRFTTLADGRIIMAVGLRVSQAGAVDGIGYFESSDNGQTWSGLNQRIEAIFDAIALEGGGIIELANGDLLYPYYGRDAADATNRRSCAVLRSTDGGTTWSALATIADGPADAKDYAEPGLVQMDNGDIIALIRQELGVDMWTSQSTDNGATWSAPVLTLPNVSGLMTPLKLASGAIISPQRSQILSGIPTQIVFSQNGGDTWQKGIDFAQSPNTGSGQMTYGQFQEDANGVIYLAYGYENISNTVSDIMFVKTD